MTELMRDIKLRLLKGRTQRYLRYMHLREAIAMVAGEIESVCICGTGHGLAEVAIGLEFPHLKWTLTDIIAKGYPNYHTAMNICWENGLTQFSFSIWNVMRPTTNRFDMVCSTEMLEHIADAPRAARNMRGASTGYIYCLVPFSDEKTNLDLRRRQDAWDRFEHFCCGYDKDSIESLLGIDGDVRGTYWADAGQKMRQKLIAMSDEQIENAFDDLIAEAQTDLQNQVPVLSSQAAGIRVLNRADATLPKGRKLIPTIGQISSLVK